MVEPSFQKKAVQNLKWIKWLKKKKPMKKKSKMRKTKKRNDLTKIKIEYFNHIILGTFSLYYFKF